MNNMAQANEYGSPGYFVEQAKYLAAKSKEAVEKPITLARVGAASAIAAGLGTLELLKVYAADFISRNVGTAVVADHLAQITGRIPYHEYMATHPLPYFDTLEEIAGGAVRLPEEMEMIEVEGSACVEAIGRAQFLNESSSYYNPQKLIDQLWDRQTGSPRLEEGWENVMPDLANAVNDVEKACVPGNSIEQIKAAWENGKNASKYADYVAPRFGFDQAPDADLSLFRDPGEVVRAAVEALKSNPVEGSIPLLIGGAEMAGAMLVIDQMLALCEYSGDSFISKMGKGGKRLAEHLRTHGAYAKPWSELNKVQRMVRGIVDFSLAAAFWGVPRGIERGKTIVGVADF